MRSLTALALVGLGLGLVLASAGCRADGADQQVPDAVTADPDHYSVEFENDAVRLLRIRYGPGETSVMHRHPANCAIFLTDLTARMERADGEAAHLEAGRGQVLCGDAEVHRPSNMADEPLELILVELRGREAFSP